MERSADPDILEPRFEGAIVLFGALTIFSTYRISALMIERRGISKQCALTMGLSQYGAFSKPSGQTRKW
jgi:hypothetical protein